MAIDWKRGLLRLWIVVSATWVIATGALAIAWVWKSVPDAPTEEVLTKYIETVPEFVAQQSPSARDVPWSEEASSPEEWKNADSLEQLDRLIPDEIPQDSGPLEIEAMPNSDDRFRVKLHGEILLENVPKNLEASEIVLRMSAAIKEKRLTAVKTRLLDSIGLMWGPPVALLVAGVILGWVLAGFRNAS